MKKTTQFLLITTLTFSLLVSFQSHALAADELCTGPIYTDPTASQACATLAETQGRARGYTITCTSKQVGFPFVDPNTGLTYYFDATCTVNGYEGQGAQLLVGYTGFTGTVNNRYLTWSSVVPGWDTFAVNLKSFEAVKKCGGSNYAVNAAGEYYCTAAQTTTSAQTSTQTSTQTTNSSATTNTTAGQVTSQATYVQNIINTVNNLIQKYKNLNGLNNANTGGSTITTEADASITVNAEVLNVRQAPNTQANILSKLNAGNSFDATCYVIGESVEGSSSWWKTGQGSYIWAGGTTKQPSNTSLKYCQ